MRRFLILQILFVICVFNLYSNGYNTKSIIFLSNYKLYKYDFISKELTRIAISDTSISEYSISPLRNYLAYTSNFKYCSNYANNDDMSYLIPNSVLKIINLKNGERIAEFKPSTRCTYFSDIRWCDIDKLYACIGDGIEAICNFAYTINSPLVRVPYDSIFPKFVLSNNYPNKFYVDNNDSLRKYDLLTKKDLVMGSIYGRCIDAETSNNNLINIWFEMNVNYPNNIDRVHVYFLSNLTKEIIYEVNSIPRASKKHLSVSPNDSLVAIESDKIITIINLYSKTKVTVTGSNLCWIDSNTFVFNDKGNLSLYDLSLKKSELFIKNAMNACKIE